MESKELTTVEIPQPLSDELYQSKLTKRQRNFVLLFVHSEGKKSASQCAYEAGYGKHGCRTRASELQKHPDVMKAITAEISANAAHRSTPSRENFARCATGTPYGLDRPLIKRAACREHWGAELEAV